MNYKRIFSKIDGKEVISFDLFDTLIKRDVNHYREVFDILEKTIVLEYGNKYKGLAQKRINAEINARNRLKYEITIDEIYDCLECDIADVVKNKEKSLECALAVPNEVMRPIFEYCKRKGKRIIIVSDMYLPKEVLIEIIKKNGYEGINEIFISAESRKTKRKGLLFRYVKDSLSVQGKQILHIGDNLRSDYLMGWLNGISCVKIRRCYDNTIAVKKDSFLYPFINNRVNRYHQFGKRVGYEVYGPFLLGFVQWLKWSMKKNDITNVYFASRDGYVIKQAYDILYDDDETINSKYMLVSRRSLQVPLIDNAGNGFLDFLDVASFSQIESNLNLYARVGGQYDIKEEKYEVHQNQIEQFYAKDKTILKNIDEIFSNAYFERKALLRYIDEIQFRGKVAFVDVGWKCSSQQSLCTLCPEVEIKGFYMGVHKSVADKNIDAEGYIFSPHLMSDNFYAIMGGMSVLEAVFTSTSCSLKRYTLSDDRVVFEYNEDDKLSDNDDVFLVQEGMLDFIRDYKNSTFFDTKIELSVEDAFAPLKRIIVKPKKKELEWFGKLKMENGGKIISIFQKSNLLGYIFNIGGLIHDYRNSGWKIGFIRKYMKIMPAKKIFEMTYRIVKER